MEEVEGIIVSETNYGESSKIINVLTLKYGLIGIMAKGCRGPKSALRSVTTKLTYGKFIIYYKKDKLSILKEVNIIDYFYGIRTDIEKISYATYLLELSEQVYRQCFDNDIINLLIDALTLIDKGFNPIIIMNIIELKYLYFLGIMPVIDCCSVCGSKENIVTLSSYKGGFVCSNCYSNEKVVNVKTIKLVRMLYYVDLKRIDKLDINVGIVNEINSFLDDYFERYAGLYLKSKKFIKDLQKI